MNSNNPGHNYWSNIKLIIKICFHQRRSIMLMLFATVLLFNFLELIIPKTLQLLVASLSDKPLMLFNFSLEDLITPDNRIIIFTAILPIIALLKWIIGYCRGILQAQLGQGALYDLRNKIFDHVQDLSFAYHDQAHSGRFIANIVEDVAQVSMFVEMPLVFLFRVTAGILCTYIYMSLISWQATLASLGIIALFSISIFVFRRYGYPIYLKSRANLEKMVSIFSENVEGHLLVRSFGRQQDSRDKFNSVTTEYHKTLLFSRGLWSILNQSLLWSVILGIFAVMYIGIFQMQRGDFGSDQVFLLFLLQSAQLLHTRILSRTIDRWTNFSVSANRLGELFKTNDFLPDIAPELSQSCPLHLPIGKLQLKNVSFKYSGSSQGLNNISLTINPGETIALIGESGSGKSTLALLLCRFYDPESGTVTINNKDIKELPINVLRKEFAFVFQDTFLFSASIRENIAYGKANATNDDIVNAATLAKAHDFIVNQLNGYETKIGEKGVTLSGGQRQRLAIARAILRKPKYIIFDDATSSLDMQTEQEIQESIDALPQDISKIIIAHRFSSIENADKVYVLSDGNIIESGTPEELNNPQSEMTRILQLEQENE